MRIAERTRNTTWSRERIEALGTPELRQLHANALRLNEPEIAALCDELLGARPRGRPPVRKPKSKVAKAAPVKSDDE
jgi:hypothetical protein